MIYVMSKLCFLANVLAQTHFLNEYLVPKASASFGFYAWRDLWYGNTTWEQNSLFPRVTLCDFGVREMGQTQNFTVQCVLLLNVFTEKAFIVLWAWYNVLTLLTLFNLTTWIFSLANPRSSEHFIFNHLEMSGENCFACESARGLNGNKHSSFDFVGCKNVLFYRSSNPSSSVHKQISKNGWHIYFETDCSTCRCGLHNRFDCPSLGHPL